MTANDETYQRALVYDFPQDKRTWDLGDEFMFGRSILAAPITVPQYTEEKSTVDFTEVKTVTKYLPKGADWYDFWTKRRYKGGQDVTLATSFFCQPMFIRAGSILPIAPVVMYAQEKPWDTLDIVVYPGADATFTLYEDEGDSYRYEQGQYSTITFTWNDKGRTLAIADRQGQFPGMLQTRRFNVRLVGETASQPVDYRGSAVSVALP